jgi:hypothetical protein
LLRDFFFSTWGAEILLLCIELTSAVKFSSPFGAMVDGICAIDWRDFGLLGLVVAGSIFYKL